MLTVACWKWKGWRRSDFYCAAHVNALYRMVQKHLHVPYRFVCFTDDPKGIECETQPIWDVCDVGVAEDRANCFRRLRFWSEQGKELVGDQVLSLDLDIVILGDITHLVDTKEDFKAAWGTVADMNGSVWLYRTGTRQDVWDDLNRHANDRIQWHNQTKREKLGKIPLIGSDQAWLSMKYDYIPTWTKADGLYHFRPLLLNDEPMPTDCRILCFAGRNKPWHIEAAHKFPEVYNTYQDAYEGIL